MPAAHLSPRMHSGWNGSQSSWSGLARHTPLAEKEEQEGAAEEEKVTTSKQGEEERRPSPKVPPYEMVHDDEEALSDS